MRIIVIGWLMRRSLLKGKLIQVKRIIKGKGMMIVGDLFIRSRGDRRERKKRRRVIGIRVGEIM